MKNGCSLSLAHGMKCALPCIAGVLYDCRGQPPLAPVSCALPADGRRSDIVKNPRKNSPVHGRLLVRHSGLGIWSLVLKDPADGSCMQSRVDP